MRFITVVVPPALLDEETPNDVVLAVDTEPPTPGNPVALARATGGAVGLIVDALNASVEP